MLLYPLEELLDLPSVFVQQGYLGSLQVEVVRKEDKFNVALAIVITYPAYLSGITLPGFSRCEDSDMIGTHPVAFAGDGIYPSELEIIPRSENEECLFTVYVVQPFKVVVTPVEYVEAVLFVRNVIHRKDVMYRSGRDVYEAGDVRLDIVKRMQLDRSLPFAESRPPKDAQTQVDDRGVESIHIPFDVDLKIIVSAYPASISDHVCGKIFVDFAVTPPVSLRERA
jgi:hypothetical protein